MAQHKYGLVHDRHDERDLRFSAVANKLSIIHLPPKVDLRPKCSPVRDQGDLGSCTGFASIVGFRESLLVQSGQPFTSLSPLFEYYWERVKEHTVNDDSGAQIRDAMKVLAKFGAAPEADWPYDITKFKDAPPSQAVLDAKKFPIKAYHRVHNIIEIKQALAISHPVVIGIEVWDSFETDDVAKTGAVPIPNFNNETMQGGHAVCVVGYDDATHTFLVKNSWGTNWGMAGYFTLPYGYFSPNLNLVMDMWTGRA
jgi:C1A family cysteine protease